MININVYKHYRRIMAAETALSVNRNAWHVPDAEEMESTASQLAEIAHSSTVRRSYTTIYHLTDQKVAFESDGAHANLMAAIVDKALGFKYDLKNLSSLYDGYTYREIMEAIRRHDLPENLTGDIPDNGNRDEKKYAHIEQDYQQHYSRKSPSRDAVFEAHVVQLLYEMEQKSSPMGRLLYVADKISAVFMVLCYENIGLFAYRYASEPHLSDRDREEMSICCSHSEDGAYFASEMWAIDYFKARALVNFDETGFFTALVVMYTLIVKQAWYKWREEDYDVHSP